MNLTTDLLKLIEENGYELRLAPSNKRGYCFTLTDETGEYYITFTDSFWFVSTNDREKPYCIERDPSVPIIDELRVILKLIDVDRLDLLLPDVIVCPYCQAEIEKKVNIYSRNGENAEEVYMCLNCGNEVSW